MPRVLPSRAVAAIDCGSNSTRLIVVNTDAEVLERQMRITRLGEGVDATGALALAAIERTMVALRAYREVMDAYEVKVRRVVATSAVRDSENAEDFLAGAATIVGVRPEILSGDAEGRLSFAGATARLPEGTTGTGPVLVVDIGGGSTELVIGRTGAGGGPPVTRSLDLGCVRVSERFFRHDPPLPEELAKARQTVENLVTDAASTLPRLAPNSLLVGLAGTVSTLSCLQHRITVYDRSKVHHSVLGREEVTRWLGVLASEGAAARSERPGMDPGREDVIVGGALVLDVVMAVFGCRRCLVSEDDILDGLAATLLSEM
jgi:exopolyphosphatase/guanosine-5'-triphosphate,3'-diphosphate pyrophosphatase